MDLFNNDKPFIWRKKYEEEGRDLEDKHVLAAIEEEVRQRIEANKVELNLLRERQRKNELERQRILNDNEFLQRQKEAERHQHWEEQEDDFIMRQRKQGSKIRIRDGRAKPIDLFSHYINTFGANVQQEKANKSEYTLDATIDLSDSAVELLNPCDWFNGLRQVDLEELEPDIIKFMNADSRDNRQFWEDLLEITRNELGKLVAAKNQAKETLGEASDEISSSVVDDVMALFEGKSIGQLNQLEDEVSEMLEAGEDACLDYAFYKNALSRLRAHRAKLRLTQDHKSNLKRQKEKLLKSSSGDKKPKKEPNVDEQMCEDGNDDEGRGKTMKECNIEKDDNTNQQQEPDEEVNDEVDEDEIESDFRFNERARCMKLYEEGGFSPKTLTSNELNSSYKVIDPVKDFELLVEQRNKIFRATSLDDVKLATMSAEERSFMKTASKDMDRQVECEFSCEEAIGGSIRHGNAMSHSWSDKYKPRKPRYFNRVHTGFEWNKYNQTHYDIDNPPPKVVQGYKFNIFYPDLMEKSRTPTFSLTPCKDDKDFCTIRFSAGPPYEDIAFRIVNREWNNSHKSGYRCQFINSILQLWFQFKRYRYRR